MITVLKKLKDEIAVGVWDGFDSNLTEAQIIEKFTKKHGVPPAKIYMVKRTGYSQIFAGPRPQKESEK